MTDRTIVVDDPLDDLEDRIEWAEDRYDKAADATEEAYFSRYLQFMRDRIDELQTDGLSEATLVNSQQAAADDWDAADERTEDTVARAARADVDSHILREFFGRGPVELGEVVQSSVYTDGMIELVGADGQAVRLQVRDETDALAKADLFLREAGRSIDELRDPNAVGGIDR